MTLSRKGVWAHVYKDSLSAPERPQGLWGAPSSLGWPGGPSRHGAGVMVNIYLPWLPRMTCPLPEEAGQARRCLIPNGKFRPHFTITTAICHLTRRQKNSLMQTMLPPSPVFPAPFGKVTECAASPDRPEPSETVTSLPSSPRAQSYYSARWPGEKTEMKSFSEVDKRQNQTWAWLPIGLAALLNGALMLGTPRPGLRPDAHEDPQTCSVTQLHP